MKIGILTFWSVPNYGAFAQAYALNKVITSLFPKHDIKHIGYLHPVHYNLYNGSEKTVPCINDFFSLKEYILFFKSLLKKNSPNESFIQAWNYSIPHKKIRNKKQLETLHWDLIILGSDAIWEYSIKDFGDDIHLIGNNLNCNRIISYAASFGNMSRDNFFPKFVKTGLEKIDAITVRDEESAKIVNTLVNKKADIVLDPTLLWDFSTDENIPETTYENYILVYGYDFNDSIKTEVLEYARSHKLQIIGAGLYPDWCDINLSGILPLEWMGLFKKTKFVVTSTFHGLMFSIINSKKVYFYQVEYVKNRSQTLLELTGINKILKNKNLYEILNSDWNYEKIMQKLEIQKQFSIDKLILMIEPYT